MKSIDRSQPPGSRILQLGEPGLRVACEPVTEFGPTLRDQATALNQTLLAFRARHGFGRAIAAPQIGIPYRLIAMELGSGPFVIINPEIYDSSTETSSMWDDCMSFPHLLIRLRRATSISVRFSVLGGNSEEWANLPFQISELFQHEIDHLDGVLAIDRALSGESVITRDAFEIEPEYFANQVDHRPALPVAKSPISPS